MSNYFRMNHHIDAPCGEIEVTIDWRAPYYEDDAPQFVDCQIGSLTLTEPQLIAMVSEAEWKRQRAEAAKHWWEVEPAHLEGAT